MVLRQIHPVCSLVTNFRVLAVIVSLAGYAGAPEAQGQCGDPGAGGCCSDNGTPGVQRSRML